MLLYALDPGKTVDIKLMKVIYTCNYLSSSIAYNYE